MLEELAEWQSRPLDRGVWPVVFIDALMVKIRDGVVSNRGGRPADPDRAAPATLRPGRRPA